MHKGCVENANIATKICIMFYFKFVFKKSVITVYAPVAFLWKLKLCEAFGCKYGTKGFAFR